MKNIKLYIGLLGTILITLSSCKNDLDVLAPGEETVSVYGVLNPNESVQNIRINKVYLTDGDALTAAKDVNQINYAAGELIVTLQRFMTGSTTPTLTTKGNNSKKEIVLTETVVTTADGNFSTQQRIWQTTDKLFSDGEYKLTIKNVSSGKEFTAQNVIIDSVKPNANKPFIYHPTLYPSHGNYITTGSVPTPTAGYIDYSNLVPTATIKIKFNSIPNAKLYDVVLRFHYIDTLLSAPNVGVPSYIDLNFPTQKSNSLNGNEPMEVSYITDEFYSNIANQLSKKQNSGIKKRRAFYLEYIIRAGAESLYTFLQVNAPSNTIAQDKPNYSNIKGGVGIFSTSSRSSITHDMLNAYIDKIACHPSTYPYLFCKSNGVVASGPCQ